MQLSVWTDACSQLFLQACLTVMNTSEGKLPEISPLCLAKVTDCDQICFDISSMAETERGGRYSASSDPSRTRCIPLQSSSCQASPAVSFVMTRLRAQEKHACRCRSSLPSLLGPETKDFRKV